MGSADQEVDSTVALGARSLVERALGHIESDFLLVHLVYAHWG
jgi:hypothetical protein